MYVPDCLEELGKAMANVYWYEYARELDFRQRDGNGGSIFRQVGDFEGYRVNLWFVVFSFVWFQILNIMFIMWVFIYYYFFREKKISTIMIASRATTKLWTNCCHSTKRGEMMLSFVLFSFSPCSSISIVVVGPTTTTTAGFRVFPNGFLPLWPRRAGILR